MLILLYLANPLGERVLVELTSSIHLDVNSTNTRSPRGLARYMQEAESGTVFSDLRGQYSTVRYPLVTPDSNIIF